MHAQKTYGILVADDSEDDRFFLKKAVAKFPRFRILHELPDGREVVAYLNSEPPYADRKTYPLPDLLLLDLKMPRMTGYEVLQWLKSQSLSSLNVIVLSSSVLQEDKEISLKLGARGYWSKMANAEDQTRVMKEIETLLDEGSSRIGKSKRLPKKKQSAAA